ncbi:MAG: DUF4035 domain-containing protein [Proteobacteria bacterium]|nr:DUF4035 domain-containing protein [Pseudomonadota bacterium]
MRELQQRIDSCEFTDWIAYNRIDPFGNERADLHAAMIVSMLYNINRGKHEAKSPSDFMPDFGGRQENVGEQVVAAFKLLKAQQETNE